MYVSLIGEVPYKCSQLGCTGKIGQFNVLEISGEGDLRIAGMCAVCDYSSWFIISMLQILASIETSKKGEEGGRKE